MRGPLFLVPLVVPGALVLGTACTEKTSGGGAEILNVSYDATSGLYDDIDRAFVRAWHDKSGQRIEIHRSHGGSAKQARAVIDGLEASVVSLGLGYDVDALAVRGYVDRAWRERLPYRSAPFTSTIVLLVRRGNPKGIRGFDDLAREGVGVITPSPKSSGSARWSYLALWGHALAKSHGETRAVENFMRRVYANVPVFDASARGAMTTFVTRQIGDVLLSWENEALYAAREIEPGGYEVIVPPLSILAETPVAVVDKVVDRQKSRELAEAYLSFLYTEEGQRIGASHYFRPRLEPVLAERRDLFAETKLLTIDDFGGWERAEREHFGDGGSFDRIHEAGR